MMQVDIIHLLPHLGVLHERVKQFEQSLRKEFNMPIEVNLSCINNDYSIDAIAKIVSNVLAIPMNHLLSTNKKTAIAEARMITMYLCGKLIPKIKDEEISSYFSKDRTAAIHARERINGLISSNDTVIKEKLRACETLMTNYLKSTTDANDLQEA